ncbi:hypothetical protein HC928_18040 [bacterium]|nr:hypothetical protein [bacterium]
MMTTTQPLPVYRSPSRASKPLPPPPRARGYVAVVQQHPLILAGPIMRVLVLSAALFALAGGIAAILPLTRAGVVMLLVIPVMVSVWRCWLACLAELSTDTYEAVFLASWYPATYSKQSMVGLRPDATP